MRNLILVLGDQLNLDSKAFDGFDRSVDRVWIAEVDEENTHVWCHKLRIAFFLSAMRHFRDALRKKEFGVEYHEMHLRQADDKGSSFSEILGQDIDRLAPHKLIIVQPGDHRVTEAIRQTASHAEVPLEILPDQHFYCSIDEFSDYAQGRANLLLEYFYRHLRKKHHVLLNDSGQPEGGQWNYDHDNRESFGRSGPADLPSPKTFRADPVTTEVLTLVEQRFAEHPGEAADFQLPVTRRQARAFLKHFIITTLPNFGRFEDAMWKDEAFLYHSRLSALLNVKLLNPRECVDAAVNAYYSGEAPLNSVEGFVRQILGWREFVRGIYWLHMPRYAELNHLEQHRNLPSFFWDGRTEMNCIRQSMQHVVRHGYSHHIHRLMVLGNFALLWGVSPQQFHEWHMAMYLDAIDWVSLPNTLGMSQFGDGGIIGTKPYCSSGNYINRMSNFCESCRFNYKERSGENACPFTTLYWDFLNRHYETLKSNARMKFPIKNLEKLRRSPTELNDIVSRAENLRKEWEK